jgi:diguanylate cyclase (GGDEF)-like protein
MDRRDVQQPFSRLALFRTAGLLVGLSLMALLFASRSRTSGFELKLIIQAATLTAVTVLATVFLPWERLPRSLQATPPLVFLVVAFLTREATGGTDSTYSQLVLLPVVWLGVYGSAAELAGGLLGVGAALVAPLLVPGSTAHAWRETLFLIASATVLGVVLHIFFSQIRTHTSRLSTLALTDHLTDVPNRRAWDEALEQSLAEATRTSRPVSVAVLDIDHFKLYNDRYGHQAGDVFLKEVAAKWRAQLRESDVLARLGGDEFGVILPSCPAEAGLTILRRLCSGIPADMTCSGGVAGWDGRETPFDLFGRADHALYQAKETGRGRIVAARAALAG